MDIYKRMAAKNKTCRKRQCKRGTVKWKRGGMDPKKVKRYPVVKDAYPAYRGPGPLYQVDSLAKENQENPLLAARRTQAPTSRQTQSTTSTPAAPRTPAAPKQTTRRSLETKPAERRTTRKAASTISLAPNLNTKTPASIPIQTSQQPLILNTETTGQVPVRNVYFDFREKMFSDIKKYVDSRKMKDVKYEDALTRASIDVDTPEAKIFDEFIKSRYKYFKYSSILNNVSSYMPQYYYYKQKFKSAKKRYDSAKEKYDKMVKENNNVEHFSSFIPTPEERIKMNKYDESVKERNRLLKKKHDETWGNYYGETTI